MRPLHLSDLHHAACALRETPPEVQAARISAAIAHAKLADAHRIATGKAHPLWGHGTLSSAFGVIEEPSICDAAYLRALAAVVQAVRDR